MSDIVERLGSKICDWPTDAREAADEIERLLADHFSDVSKMIANAVAGERAAILEMIEAKHADYANLYFGDYCLRTLAAVIRARGEKP